MFNNFNPRYAHVIQLMKDYDSSPLGSQERSDIGLKLDHALFELSERDIKRVENNYKELVKKENAK